MKRISTILVALLCTATAIFADLPFRNHRYDAFKVLPVSSEQIVFIGNSITNMHEWWEAFGNPNVVNRGVSGAVTDEALANIEAIAVGKPKKVFMMLGTNDLGTAGINTTEHVIQNVTLMVERLQEVSPTTEIYIQSILPSGLRDQALQQATNTALEALCAKKDITYIDLWDDLLGVATNSNGLSYDKLHLTADAYKIWCDKVAPYVTDTEGAKSAYTNNAQSDGGLGGAHGMRATVFSKLPVESDDILIIGDEMVHGGEWHELLRSDRVKSRGTGWGYAGMSLTNTMKMIEPIFHDGATPAQVYLHIGVDDVVFQSTELATILTNYKAVVAKIQELSPNTEVVMTSVQPMSNTTKNTDRVVPFNALLKAYADESTTDKVHYLDICTDFMTEGNVANTTYFTGNYLYGKGYVKVAQKIEAQIKALEPTATVSAITDAEAETLYTRFTNRTALGNAIVKAATLPEGEGVGYYKTTDMADVKTQIAAAYEALKNSTTATDVFSTEVEALTTAISTLLPKINMPTYSTEESEVWYQLYTPNRSSKYLTSNGVGAGVTGTAANNYATSMWKFVERTDKSLDIINRHDNSYLAPTAAGSTQLTTSEAQPTAGWTLSYSDAPGLFIASSSTVQLHQTNDAAIWNWGGGANRSDAGCQYMVSIVTGEPDEIPDPSLMTLTLTSTQFANGTSTYTYHGTTTSGAWYGKLVTGTTPTLTIESTDEAANNIGWSSNRPWLKAGYTYNLTLAEGYYIVGYELTTLSTSANYSNTYTYTTAEGTGTSEAQNSSTEKTVIAENLSTGTVAITVNGDAASSNYGILITKLVIKYKEVLPTLTYTINKANGNLYNGTNANQNWNSAWKSTAEPQLVFSCGANNMNWHNDTNVQMMTGTAGSATYTLAAPEGYVIGNYSFTFANNSHDTGISLDMTDGNTYTTTRAAQTISARNQALSTMSFVLSGTNNNGVVLTNFTVTLVDPVIAGTEDPEDEEELNAAKTEAKATVTANAANLKANVGYYSYAVAGVKVYEADDVTAAIDAATTVAEVTAIAESYALNIPEVGKYYRIKGKSSGKYIDAAGLNNTQMNMKAEADRDFLGSIFLLDEGIKWLNMATNTYIKDTHSIGANKNGANTWTFEAGSIGYIKLKSDSSSPWLHDNTGTNKTDRCSSDGADHEFSLEEVHAYTITVNGPTAANATATWNGETKKLPATWSLFEGMTVTDATLTINCASHTLTSFKEGETAITGNSIEIAGLTANRVFTTTFAPNFFSTTYGEKWMHITRASNANHVITLGNTVAGTIPTFNNINYADEGTLWCFVGTAESFKIYNRTSGDTLALTPSETPANGVTIELAETAEATSWHLISYNDGYAIAPVGDTSHGINSFGGNDYLGGPIKFWGVGDGGTHWKFNMIDTTKPLTLSVEVNGDQPYHVNYRVAELTTTIAEQTSKSIVAGDVEAMTYYLPVGATISLENTFTYRGYTFDGFKDAEGNAAEYTNATIPAGGVSVTVSYSVDEANKYQYLYYSNDPVMNKPYRIPAIAVTREGTILAVTDHRPGGSDVGFAPVDIKIRRSKDNGLTWTDEEFIADGTGQHVTVNNVTHTNVFNYAFGDAAIVADRESDEVLVMCVGGKQNFPGATATSHNYIARLRSHDGGVTWDNPENVTANFMDVTPLYNNENPNNYKPILPDAYSMFYGSGRIFQSRVFKAEGSQYYRIYAAILVREVREDETGASHNNYVVYSDNFGETWNLLGTRCVNGGDEAKVEELPDGTIIISSRKAGGRYFNIFTFTDIATAQGSWGTTATSTEVYDGGGSGTDGEIYKVKAIRNSDNAICDVMLQSIPLGPGRSNVMIHYKEMEYNADGTNKYAPADFATGWNRGLQVSDRASAYSTMALQTDGNFGFFYEEVPEGYCMVYIPLSLEEITKGAYSLYTVNSTIGEHEVGTFYATEAMQIPTGVTAYVATEKPTLEDGTGTITMTELKGIIPANTGAVLRGAAATYEFIPSISYGTSVEGNMLVGYEAADNKAGSQSVVTLPDVNSYSTYVLSVENNAAGFYRKEKGFSVYNNKAYLKVPATMSATALRIRFGADEDTTGIEMTTGNSGQATVVYDLMGRRVEKMEKGVYIVNGKKMVIK